MITMCFTVNYTPPKNGDSSTLLFDKLQCFKKLLKISKD